MGDTEIKGYISREGDSDEETLVTEFTVDNDTTSTFETDISVDSDADVDFPKFLAESGIDAGTDLDKLKENLGSSFDVESFETNNPMLNNLGVFALLIDDVEF